MFQLPFKLLKKSNALVNCARAVSDRRKQPRNDKDTNVAFRMEPKMNCWCNCFNKFAQGQFGLESKKSEYSCAGLSLRRIVRSISRVKVKLPGYACIIGHFDLDSPE